jgi:hypothetical protein
LAGPVIAEEDNISTTEFVNNYTSIVQTIISSAWLIETEIANETTSNTSTALIRTACTTTVHAAFARQKELSYSIAIGRRT